MSLSKIVINQINHQINIEKFAAEQYFSFYIYFKHQKVALDGLANYFLDSSNEERTHSLKLTNFILSRGGHVTLMPIGVPEMIDVSPIRIFENTKNIFKSSLKLEKKVYALISEMSINASTTNDTQLVNFLDPFLDEQIRSIDELERYISQLNLIGEDGAGLYKFDKDIKK